MDVPFVPTYPCCPTVAEPPKKVLCATTMAVLKLDPLDAVKGRPVIIIPPLALLRLEEPV